MPIFRRSFRFGRQNKDIEARLLVDGEYRDALNIDLIHTENSDSGAVEKSLSNLKKTDLPLGNNAVAVGGYADEYRDKIYWLVHSDIGCFLIEYDYASDTSAFVLQDTRPVQSRVLKLEKDIPITNIQKFISDSVYGDLLIIPNENMEAICLNVERAKTYGENGFEKEDIYLIKRPPLQAPITELVYTQDLNNNIEEKFLLFAYRYRFLDGEYSALSSFTNYKFIPKPFRIDYFTNENLGMVNSFNGVRITFDTGDKRVTDIQIIVKESNSNVLYIVENFNKVKEGWSDLQPRIITYSNSKIYTALPEMELYRTFDNVPRNPKSLSIVGNRLVFGNYWEGYDIADINGNEIKTDYSVSATHNNLNEGEDFLTRSMIDAPGYKIEFSSLPSMELKSGKKILFNIELVTADDGVSVFNKQFFYVLQEDFSNMESLWQSDDFIEFFEVVKADYASNSNIDVDPSWSVTTQSELSLDTSPSVNAVVINVSPAVFKDASDETQVKVIKFAEITYATLSDILVNTSLKTNRDYEVAVIYLDEFSRKTIALTSLNNTVHISQDYSTFQNRLKISLSNPAPHWAKAIKFAVKTPPLTYENIFINKFYPEDLYTWCKLEGDNKDKVKENDILILKRAGAVEIPNILKVKVLEKKIQEKNFITENLNDDSSEIIEESGTYIKIRPNGFSMDYEDFNIHQSQRSNISSTQYPIAFVDLFTEIDGPVVKDLEVPQGSSITLFIESKRYFDDGPKFNTLNKEFFAQRDYDNLQQFFNENVLNRTLFGNEGNAPDDYNGKLTIIRGDLVPNGTNPSVTPNPDGKLYLRVEGTKAGGTRSRMGYLSYKITIRSSEGIYAFETETIKETNVGVFFESEETFLIENGNHIGNLQSQDVDNMIPAEFELSFHNCYSQGNGVESYKIKDGFNKPYLNIDTRPTTTSVEKYRAFKRYADLTYSEPFIESSNINGLNEFNLARANFKELNKDFGSIQISVARDNDLVVFQEEKASTVMYGKDALYSADGSFTLAAIPEVLGRQLPYAGNSGISKNPESLAVNGNRIYYTNSNRGVVNRLSTDGITEIVYGMMAYFRTLFGNRKYANKIGGFDPYKNQYVLSIGENPDVPFVVDCDNVINKLNQEDVFNYKLQLNKLSGNIVIGFDITDGEATIVVSFNNSNYVASNVTEKGNITFERDTMTEDIVDVTITPISDKISYSIMNICPIGTPIKITTIIIGGPEDLNKTVANRYRWGSSPIYEYQDQFSTLPVSRFTTETGIEGQGKFPLSGGTVNMQSFTNGNYTNRFDISKGNRMGYLVSSENYDISGVDIIKNEATYIDLTNTVQGTDTVTSGNFTFNKTEPTQNLYMIWDYTDIVSGPIVQDTDGSPSMFDSDRSLAFPFNYTGMLYRFLRAYNQNYYDPSGLPPKTLRITQLPDIGSIWYEGAMITVPFEIPVSNQISLHYQDDTSILDNGNLEFDSWDYKTDIKFQISNSDDVFSNIANCEIKRGKAGYIFAANNGFSVKASSLQRTLDVLANDYLGERELIGINEFGYNQWGDTAGFITSIDVTDFTLGVVSINPGGVSLNYAPNPQIGTGTFTYTITDYTGRTSTGIVTISNT